MSSTPDTAVSIAIHPLDSRRIYIGTRNSGVFQSRDGGRTWRAANAGLIFPEPCDRTFCPDLPTTDLTFDPRNPDVLHAIFIGTLVRSVNGGASWFRIDGGIESPDPNEQFTYLDLAFDPWQGGIFYAATRIRGVLRSRDGGATWEEINEGLPLLNVSRLEIDPNVLGGLFVVTEGAGCGGGRAAP